METKTLKAVNHFRNGNIAEALKIFSTFRIGFSKEENRTLEIAYESMTGNAGFYKSIGIDTERMKMKANEIIREKYNI
jgi:hypothetical protein